MRAIEMLDAEIEIALPHEHGRQPMHGARLRRDVGAGAEIQDVLAVPKHGARAGGGRDRGVVGQHHPGSGALRLHVDANDPHKADDPHDLPIRRHRPEAAQRFDSNASASNRAKRGIAPVLSKRFNLER